MEKTNSHTAIMKATDLMIGDWVQHQNHDVVGKVILINVQPDLVHYQNKSATIQAVYPTGNILCHCKVSLLEPIPLTTEILEKNGFEKCPYKNSYWYCDEMLELFVKIVCILPIENRKLRSSLPTPAPRLTAGEDDVYIRCDYVHELQHALRFCGIDKEIVL